MPRTPDHKDGPRYEEEIRFDEQVSDPSGAGYMRYVSGSFRMQDSSGVFDPRSGGGGESNTASNVGTAGVGVYKEKVGVDLRFKKINAGSSKVTVVDDTGNDEVDIDVAEAQIDHGSIGGLGDDDHSQYHNDTRGDTRYYQKTEFIQTSTGAPDAGKPIELDAAGHVDATMINDGDIDHTNIGSIGTNTHAQIDTHLASTSNPHTVTKSQIGLGNVTNDAQLKRADGDINSFTEKTSPVGADVLLIEDSAASYAKKRVQITNLPTGSDADAIHDNVASEISAITEKSTPVSADLLLIEDSADSNNKKRVQVGNLPGGGGGGLEAKAGSITQTAFGTGNNCTITFTTAFSDANYSIALSAYSASGVPMPFWSGKTASNFKIFLHHTVPSGVSFNIDWTCTKHGES